MKDEKRKIKIFSLGANDKLYTDEVSKPMNFYLFLLLDVRLA